ncbi:hypothetical protein [Streptomyces sp. NBC_00247]|uniref:hypothetical protein n=1 Tax=Streptomyces sp. NBC_00247 TaxID=2975689 RepID=UPI003FA7EF13
MAEERPRPAVRGRRGHAPRTLGARPPDTLWAHGRLFGTIPGTARAVALSAATVLTPAAGEFDADACTDLLPRVTVEPLAPVL